MPTTPTIESMLKAIRQSGLIDAELLRSRVDQIREDGFDSDDPAALLEKLVEVGDLTRWQADKIKQGKNKGFFLGKYRLLSLLGRGGMSSVYLAEHVLMRRRCAIKVLPVKKVDESSYLGRFHREAQAVAALDHPNIVRAYDVDSDDGHGTTIHFLVMEYVDGRNLQSIVDEDGPCDFATSVDYIRQAAEGLAHAHEAGFVHRDIKPGNLLVDPKGVVKLLDLGLARYFNNQDETSLTIEHNEKVLGTADYLAPEQALNSHTVDLRADIYGLGCTLYFMLTGKPPFDKGTLAQKLLAHQTEQPPSILESRTDTPSSVQTILEKMMAKKADDRYQTAKDLADDLSDWLVDNGHENLLDSRLQRRASDPSKAIETGESAPQVANEVSPPTEPKTAPEPETPIAPPAEFVEAEVDPTPEVDEGLGAFLAGLDAPASPPAPSQDEESVATEEDNQQVEEEIPEPVEEIPESEAVETEVPEEVEAEVAPPEEEQISPVVPEADNAVPNFDFLNSEQQAAPEPAFTPSITVEEPQVDQTVDPDVPVDNESAKVVAEPIDSITKPSQSATKPKTKPKKPAASKPKPQILAAIASVIIVGVVGAWSMGFFTSGSSNDDNVSEDDKANSKDNDGDSTDTPKTGLISGEIKVGKEGDFKNISEAIKYLREHAREYSADSLPEIRIAPGEEITDSISIDNSDFTFPKGVKVICEGDRPALLKSEGSSPIFSLNGVEGLQVSGLRIDAAGAETAIQLAGYCSGLTLSKLDISGFSGNGIKASGVAGLLSKEVRIDQCTLKSGQASTVGMVVADGSASSSEIQILRCRFLGPMEAGIRIESTSANLLLIQQSIFAETKNGIQITGNSPFLKEIKVANNTFFQCETGIRFNSAPGSGSSMLGFYQNLFGDQRGAELLLPSKADRDEFLKALSYKNRGSHLNWTSRAELKSDNEFDLFANGGRKNAPSNFRSTTAGDADFLKPLDPKLKLNSAPNGTNLKFIGAVSP